MRVLALAAPYTEARSADSARLFFFFLIRHAKGLRPPSAGTANPGVPSGVKEHEQVER
jgi:hypothetical protein